jgi:uncharacterized protein YbjQ (UPF0145 family)
VRLFGRGGQGERDARQATELEQVASREAMAQGGLPLRAQERLRELGASGGLFSSDLSVNEFALVDSLGLRPLGLVMGSSIYHVGWQQRPGSWGFQANATSQELRVLSEAWNEVRRLAFGRLEQEARLLGADAVVGVRLTRGGHDWAVGAVEYVAVGTAVRIEGASPLERPALTDLSGQDYWKLWRAGYRPLGVAGASTVFYIVPGWSQRRAQSGFFSSWANQELRDFTQGVYDARELALARLTADAASHGAAGVVGVSIAHSAEEREVDSGGSTRTDLIVTMHVLGTTIGERGSTGVELAPSTTLDLRKESRLTHVLGGSR